MRTYLENAFNTNDARTENGAVAHSTTNSAALDFFSRAGAMRNSSEEEIKTLYQKVIDEDINNAVLLLYWLRDCRGGAGEKRVSKIAYKVLTDYLYLMPGKTMLFGRQCHDIINFGMVEVGSWKDVIELNPGWVVERFVKAEDVIGAPGHKVKNFNLLCKYLPRKGKVFNSIWKSLKWTPKKLRKFLVENSNTVEQKICANDFKSIDYSTVPSIANRNYSKVFNKHDGNRYSEFLNSVVKGEVKINASTLVPHDVIKMSSPSSDALWKNLPNYLEGSKENILPLCDVSGSMGARATNKHTCLEICMSLGLYVAERTEGIFKNVVMTFSANPQIERIPSSGTLQNKFDYMRRMDWGYNTDFNKVFDTLLKYILDGQIPREEIPTKILVFSDMQFDKAHSIKPNFDAIKCAWEEHGLELPTLVFWNLRDCGNSPVKENTPNTVLVSGFSPAMMENILNGKAIPTPLEVMEQTIRKEKYFSLAPFILPYKPITPIRSRINWESSI